MQDMRSHAENKTKKKRENPCGSHLDNNTTSKQQIRFEQALTAEFTIFNIAVT